MEIFNQPFDGHLGDRLITLLESSHYQQLNIIVAFAKNSGVLRIKDALETFRKHGGTIHAYVGVDLGGTSYEALTSLLPLVNSLHVVHSEQAQTFHTKIYDFIGHDEDLIIVGSHNLTSGGLWTNFESSALIPVHRSDDADSVLQQAVEKHITELSALGRSIMTISTQHDIDELLEQGYVLREMIARTKRTNTMAHGQSSSCLFGNGLPTALPRINIPRATPQSSPASVRHTAMEELSVMTPPSADDNRIDILTHTHNTDDEPTMWFETRAMTGGSRNILDLSMKSLIVRGNPSGTPYEHSDPQFMRGGVEFFGIDPTDTSSRKDIVINFDGIDYTGNTILYPEGDKANGTWRLQIKGISAQGAKITDTLSGKGHHYLTHKILTFTKVRDDEDYYFMSVIPETELTAFASASWLLAHNGSTTSSKLMGLLY